MDSNVKDFLGLIVGGICIFIGLAIATAVFYFIGQVIEALIY